MLLGGASDGIASDVCFVSIFCSLNVVRRLSSCNDDAGDGMGATSEVKSDGDGSVGGRERWLGSLAMR